MTLTSVSLNGTIATGGASAVLAIGTSQTTRTVSVLTPTAGTITASVFDESASPGIYNATATSIVTITVNGAAQSGTLSVANSTSFLNATTGVAATADATVAASSALPATGDTGPPRDSVASVRFPTGLPMPAP